MSALKVAVTGGAGFIGRHLALALHAQGDDVRVLDQRARPGVFGREIQYVQGSILDGAACRSLFSGVDEIYHVAGLAHLWARDRAQFFALNVDGTRTVLEAAQACGVARIVVTSTETVLRGWRDPATDVRENEPLPQWEALAGPYTRSKAQAHALALGAVSAGQDVRIVYPTVPVGPGDEAMTSPTVMIRDFLRSPPPAYLNCRLNLVDVGDVARGHILAARKGMAGGRYIVGGEDLWLHEILALLNEISGQPMPQRRVPFAVAYIAGTISTLIADHVTGQEPRAPLEGVKLACVPREVSIDQARTALGYAPRPIKAALMASIEWLKANGHLAKGLDLSPSQTAKKAS